MVDNLANGVTTQALTAEDVRKGQPEHRPELEAVLGSALEARAACGLSLTATGARL